MVLEQLKLEIDQLVASGQHREFHSRAARNRGVIEIKGRKLIDFTNWDLLGLNENSKIKRAGQKEIEETGLCEASPRLSSGTTLAHTSCEKRIALFLGTQSALLFSSKNQAVFTLLTALCNESDLIFYDEQIQSPVADVAYLVSAQSLPFNPSNLSSIDLSKVKGARRRFMVVESVSPITGKKAPLPELFEIAAKNQIFLLIDESYSLGSVGLRGAGVLENGPPAPSEYGVYGSLAHSLPGYGAFVAGSGLLTNYLIQRSKTLAYEVAIPSSICAAVEAGIGVVELAHKDRAIIRENVALLRANLSKEGFLDAAQSDSHVVSVMVGSTKQAIIVHNELISKGFLCDAVSLTSSLTDIGLIRLLPSVFHTAAQIEVLGRALAEIADKLIED